MDTINFSVLAIISASLLGSAHCAGMCGGFVLYNTSNSKNKLLANTLYHLGRLTTYSILGFLAGLLGYTLQKTSVFIGISHIASLVIGAMLILWGLKSFIKNKPINSLFHAKKKKGQGLVSIFYSAILKNQYSFGEKSRSYVLGLISTLLPCGWLYSFVAIAAASEDPLKGTLIMCLFWIGTVPSLLATALVSKLSLSPLQRYIPRITAILIILAGLFSIFAHHDLLAGSTCCE